MILSARKKGFDDLLRYKTPQRRYERSILHTLAQPPLKGISSPLAMALPPGFLDELRARTPLPGLIGRKTRLLKSGRNWKGCCPFHGEKTPSFYVYDDHFHCFGCGAHGDAVTFVMRADGAQFMEAAERLAGLLGRIGSLNNSGERLCRNSFVSR